MISRDQQKNRARGAIVFFALAVLAMNASAQFRPAMEKKYAEMSEAVNRGWGDRDSRVYFLLQEQRAGVDIKVPLEDIQAVITRDG